jgi:hypothetical protein
MTTAHFQDISAASDAKIRDVIRSGRTPVIQFSQGPAPAQLAQADDYCREFGAQLQIRFFGQQWRAFDTSILRHLPHVANLSIDTVQSISDFAPVAELPALTRLRFGVYDHPDGSFLKTLCLPRFTHLSLAENKRRNFDLSPLGAATALEQLFVQGHWRGIAAIQKLPRLCDVSLSGFPARHDLAFLNDLPGLRALLLILGSRTSIAEFAHAGLHSLRIVWVRRLEELGPLRRFENLQDLAVEDQLRLTELDISGLNLRRLSIANCKNLARLVGLENQPNLTHFSARGTRLPSGVGA